MADLQAASVLRSGFKGRCPRCGQGPLFRAGLNLREDCNRCGLSYAFADAGDGPAVFAILILGGLVLGGALLVEFKLRAPLIVHIGLWGVLTPILAFLLLRVLKATLIALQYTHKAEQGRFTPP
jgi:uncharacterized protein (DUF983 family)